MLLEGNILFDVIDLNADFSSYKVVILPDAIPVDDALKHKLDSFFEQGGKVLATGRSGLAKGGDSFAIDLGVRRLSDNPYQPDYYRPTEALPALGSAAFIMYGRGQRVELTNGTALGYREDPYFNREAFAFCSHQHTPNSARNGGPGMAESANGIYIAWDMFTDYATKGSLALKEIVLYALHRLLPSATMRASLPAQGIATLQEQPEERRYVNHLLYASPVRRGAKIEVIEDILPVYNVSVELRLPRSVRQVYLAPQMTPLPFEHADGAVRYTVPKLECHQMIVLDYET
jgi:hypothetical protein